MNPEIPNGGSSKKQSEFSDERVSEILKDLDSQGTKDELEYLFNFEVGKIVKILDPSGTNLESGWEITGIDESGEYAVLMSSDAQFTSRASIRTLRSLAIIPPGKVKWGNASKGDYVVFRDNSFSHELKEGVVEEVTVEANGDISLKIVEEDIKAERGKEIIVGDFNAIVVDADYLDKLEAVHGNTVKDSDPGQAG